MKRTTALIVSGIATASLAATTLPGAATAGPAAAEKGAAPTAVGLTVDNKLVTFSVDDPENTKDRGAITGMVGDTSMVGIDFRVQDGRLYGVGNQGGVYRLLVKSAKAAKVSQLTVPLEGTSFGVDFNPAADALRIVSNTGQNLRHVVNPGTVTSKDGALAYAPAPAPAAGIVGAAYTNNDLSTSTGTTLFVVDADRDQFATQVPANSGTLSLVGAFARDAGAATGFDIYSELRRGRTMTVQGFATLDAGGRSALYKVALLPGDLTRVGTFSESVVDLAVELDD